MEHYPVLALNEGTTCLRLMLYRGPNEGGSLDKAATPGRATRRAVQVGLSPKAIRQTKRSEEG